MYDIDKGVGYSVGPEHVGILPNYYKWSQSDHKHISITSSCRICLCFDVSGHFPLCKTQPYAYAVDKRQKAAGSVFFGVIEMFSANVCTVLNVVALVGLYIG